MANPYAPWVGTINYFLTHGATYSNLGGGYWALTLPRSTPSPTTGGVPEAPAGPPPIPEALNQAVGVWGKVIPISMGKRRLSPQVIWLKSPVSIGVTKTADFAVSWGYNADDNPENTTVTTLYADATKIWSAGEGALLPGGWSWTLYPGTETQLPDPTMVAVNGAIETPAYRGQIYGVFRNFPLEKFGYKLPGISAEIVGSGPEAPRQDTWNAADAHPFVILESPFTISKKVPAPNETGLNQFSPSGVRSRTYHRRGKYYFEITADKLWKGAWYGFAGYHGVGAGVATATADLGSSAGWQLGGAGASTPVPAQALQNTVPKHLTAVRNAFSVAGPPEWNAGGTLGLWIDMDEGWIKARNVSADSAWTGPCFYTAEDILATGTGSYIFAVIEKGDPLYAYANLSFGPGILGVTGTDRQTVNFGASSFLGPIPTGATAWNGDGNTIGTLGVVPLRDFISKIAVYCGLVPETDLAFEGVDDVIHGGMITKDTTFIDFLNVLGRAYGFDYFEGEQIRLVKRVIGSTYTVDKAIPQADLIVEGDRAIATNRRRDETPNEIELNYIDVTQQFRWNIQRGRRILFPVKSTTSRRKDTFAIPIITTASDALTMATKAMFRDAAQNVEHVVSLLPKHMDIEPSDILTLTAGDTEYTVKVTSVSMNVDGRISLSAVNLLTDEDMALEADPGSPNLPYSGGRWEWFTEEGPDEMYFSQDLPGVLTATEGEDGFAATFVPVTMSVTEGADAFAADQVPPLSVAMAVTDRPDILTGTGGFTDPTLTLNLNLTAMTLDPLITFARASTATYYDSAGLLTIAAVNVPRLDFDPVTHAPIGLLIEDVGTNTHLWSQDFTNAIYTKTSVTVTADQIAAPDGTTTADLLTASASPSSVQDSFGIGAVSYVMSVFVKKGTSDWFYLCGQITGSGAAAPKAYFNLAAGTLGTVDAGITSAAIEDAGNGWYRCQLTRLGGSGTEWWMAGICDANGSDAVTTGRTIYLWGAQFETTATRASSYIPTSNITASRSADFATLTGTNFSSWYNQPAGTFVAAFDTYMPSVLRGIVAVDNASTSEVIRLYVGTGNDPMVTIVDGGATQANLDLGTVAINTSYKIGVSFAANDIAACVNGGTVGTDVAATMPAPTQLRLGRDPTSATAFLWGHLRLVQFYNVAKSNADLQALTT